MTLLESLLGTTPGDGVQRSLRVCSWNASGLFMNPFAKGAWAAKKWAELQRLCGCHDVVVLQECHGVMADLIALEKDVGSHQAFGTSC